MNDQACGIANLIAEQGYGLSINILEIGALPLSKEPCHQLLSSLPGSRILAFEPDVELCQKLNAKAAPGHTYYPVALGRANEKRVFYETEHSMCSSLYRPDPRWDQYFNALSVMREKSACVVETQTIDNFLLNNNVPCIDFIKIDVQGAEYEIFQGAAQALGKVLCIIAEVEFIPLYEQQPLFGDVDALLRKHGFMFHKFLGLAGRAMKPIIINNNVNYPSQHM